MADNNELPNIDDILKIIEPTSLTAAESSRVAQKNQSKRDYEAEHEQISIENRREKQARRAKWDKILSRLVILGFVLSYVMIFLIGTNALSFSDSAFAVPSVIAVGIVQTYGLAKLAVSYFFSDDSRKPSKN
jgi:uncharacterized membrane protein